MIIYDIMFGFIVLITNNGFNNLFLFFWQKPVMYSVLAGGSSVCLYLLQLFWENMRLVLTEYKTYFLTCLTTTSVISFIICYRFGPVSDPRSIKLIQWTLQVNLYYYE